jgi:hypothetical protein
MHDKITLTDLVELINKCKMVGDVSTIAMSERFGKEIIKTIGLEIRKDVDPTGLKICGVPFIFWKIPDVIVAIEYEYFWTIYNLSSISDPFIFYKRAIQTESSTVL